MFWKVQTAFVFTVKNALWAGDASPRGFLRNKNKHGDILVFSRTEMELLPQSSGQ